MTEQDRIDAINVQVTPEFISTLVELARIYGWSGDYIEVAEFVKFCALIAGQNLKFSDLEEYQHDD